MDKYTVDLDQVLNDFEYSELTDQQSINQASRQNPTTSYTNNYKNSNVKHSINNVFHSLNEYLNTDITPKCAIKPPEPQASFSGEHSINNNFGINNNVNNSLNSAKLIDNPANQVTTSEKTTERVVFDQTVESQEADSCHRLTDDESPEQKTDKNASFDSSSETMECGVNDLEIKKCEEKTESTEKEENHEVGKIIDIDDEEIIENKQTNDSEEITQTGGKIGEGTDTEVAEESEELINRKEESAEIPKQGDTIVQEETVIETNESVVENEEIVDKTPEDVKNEDECGVENDEICEEDTGLVSETTEQQNKNEETEEKLFQLDETEDNKNDSKDEKTTEPIGFDSNVELDDSELNRYFDELEKEYEREDEESTTNSRPTDLPLPNKEDEVMTKAVIDLIGDPGSTPYNNVYINKELPEKQKTENSDTECSTSASPTFSDASTDSASSSSRSTEENNQGGGAEAATDSGETKPDVVQDGDTETTGQTATSSTSWLGKQAPRWIPDSETSSCMHCDMKFTVIKRRHHCRACGYVLCSKCCNLRYHLEYLNDVARVCNKCYEVLSKENTNSGANSSSGSESNSPRTSQPNPNNPLEYCSTVPPHQQISGTNPVPPSVMVPVGVLKRKGSNKARTNKSVMFCDGIRPGSDLTNLDNDFSYKGGKNEETKEKKNVVVEESIKVLERNYPVFDHDTSSFIPVGDGLPPIVIVNKTEMSFSECSNGASVVDKLREEALAFALQINLFVNVKIINMDCCINKTAWCFSTEGLIYVGQDEIVIILELLDDENTVPKDIFLHINNIYMDAIKGTSVKETGLSLHNTPNFLGSKNHAGFVYIKPTFQCLQNIIKPKEPYLIGILIHRWETPWGKLFPLRLILRLGAEYRYYPSPIISNRYRDSVFVEIGHTIINLLADFRNFSYTLPQIRGLTIHMEDKNTTITIPVNRYDQIMKSMNNSSDHILAFAGNFSSEADSHLVCIQDTQSNENAYSTHAINIHDKPRKVTGASFIVFNGSLKPSSGLTAKSSIVEDGLMIQITSDHMGQVRESLRNMKNHTIQCGCINAASDETVNIVWSEPDLNFNVGVSSPIDDKPMAGIASIRVHNGKDYVNGNRLIRWTEVFIIQNEGEASRNQDPIDISKVSETVAKAACAALVKYLDLLVSNNFYKIGIRANLNAYFVSYSAGSNSTKLPPIYMESLDNELVPVLHRNATNDCDDNTIILELIFRILNK